MVKLIGHYDSPFARRVAIAMRLLDVRYDHLAWSVFADADKIARYNPLRRVPVLVLDDGDSIIESSAIIDHLEMLSARSLWPTRPGDRRAAVRIVSLATGAADKAVSLVYEKNLHEVRSPTWVDRCKQQIEAALDELQARRAAVTSAWLFGEAIGHADIAVGCAWHFITQAHAEDFDFGRWPALRSHSEHCEALAIFQESDTPFFISA